MDPTKSDPNRTIECFKNIAEELNVEELQKFLSKFLNDYPKNFTHFPAEVLNLLELCKYTVLFLLNLQDQSSNPVIDAVIDETLSSSLFVKISIILT